MGSVGIYLIYFSRATYVVAINCHLSFFRTYLKLISSPSDTSYGTIHNSRYAAVHSQYVEA